MALLHRLQQMEFLLCSALKCVIACWDLRKITEKKQNKSKYGMSIEKESDKNSIVGKHFHYLILGYATNDLYVSLFVSTVMKGH